MRMRRVMKSLIAVLFVFVATLATDTTIQAAEALVEDVGSYDIGGQDECDFVYNKIDITGDKKKDKIRVVYKPTEYVDDYDIVRGVLKIYVNGKCAFKEDGAYRPEWSIQAVRLQSGIGFLRITGAHGTVQGTRGGLYYCRKNKLKLAYDLVGLTKGHKNGYENIQLSAKGNKIIIDRLTQFNLTGRFSYRQTLVWRKGKLQLASRKMKIKSDNPKVWTATKTIKVYKKIGSKKTAYYLKKGQKIKIIGLTYKNKDYYFKVKHVGKKGVGYIPNSSAVTYPYYFEECVFAG